MASFSVVSYGPEHTTQVASALAKRLRAGDTVLLKGRLAAGKTTFVKAVTGALGSSDLVTSPTFTLAQFYSTLTAPVLHIDAYRLDDLSEYRDLGLDEFVETSISLVEWGEKVVTEFPCHLSIELELDGSDPERRTIVIDSACTRWTSMLADLQNELLAAVP